MNSATPLALSPTGLKVSLGSAYQMMKSEDIAKRHWSRKSGVGLGMDGSSSNLLKEEDT